MACQARRLVVSDVAVPMPCGHCASTLAAGAFDVHAVAADRALLCESSTPL